MDDVEIELREKFGLNSYEARGYLALVKYPMKAKELAAAANIPMPRIYDTVRNLQLKGFVHERAGAYIAESPSVALKTYLMSYQRSFEKAKESKEHAMKKIVDLLHPISRASDELAEEPVMIRGIDGIASKFFEVLSSSQDIILMVRKALKVKGIFKDYLEALPLSGKRVRLVLPSSPRISERDIRVLSHLNIETRFHDHLVLDLMVADELDVIIGVPDRSNDEPFSAIALWVKNPSFAKSTRIAIEEIWDEGSK